MRSLLGAVLVVTGYAAFAGVVVACAKKEPPPPASGSPSSSVSVEAKPSGWVAPPVSASKNAAPPPTDDWQDVKVAKAKVALRIPKGASIIDERAGYDSAFAGSFFRVKMPSGYDLYFAEHHGKEPVDIVAEKRRYRTETKGKIVLVYEADDAVVVNRTEPPPAGTYCEVTACGRVDGRPLCASHAGAIVDGQNVIKLTELECLSVVSMARSIHAP